MTLTNNQYTFSGVDSQKGRTFAYEGTIDTAKMVLKIKDVVYPDHKLSGKWIVPKKVKWTDKVIHAVWVSSEKLAGFIDGKFLTDMMLVSPFFDNKSKDMQQM